MEIPIYIDDRQVGSLRVGKSGAYTVLRGEMEDVGRLVRLHVFGERDSHIYIGIPEPEEEKLVLLRRLSAGEMRQFPKKPEYCAERRRPKGKPAEKSPEKPEALRHILWQGGKPYFF